MKWAFTAIFAVLLLVRLPSLVQPMGGDQGIYATVGQSILHGGTPYRDAWDQKPPGVHLVYAAMFGLWHNESVVAAADLLVALLTAGLIVVLGRRLAPGTSAGLVAGAVFLLLGDPSFQRMSGLWSRAQAETFIALLVTAGFVLSHAAVGAASLRGSERKALSLAVAAGALFGVAFLFKYNAGTYLAVAAVLAFTGVPTSLRTDPRNGPWRLLARQAPWLTIGFLLPVAATAAYFAFRGALDDLVQATLVYNLRYSGETYRGAIGFVRYLVTFPIQHARLDGLWFLGGLGCVLLCAKGVAGDRLSWFAPAWVAAACLSIAVNSGRGLPQYFVQAGPALALAFGLAAVAAVRPVGCFLRTAAIVVLVVCVARINQFDKLWSNVAFDLEHVRGHSTRTEYLSRFGGRATDKFSALASAELGEHLRRTTAPSDRIFVAGFSAPVYVRAERLSASRFFWSRPLLVGFNEGRAGYGADGLLGELKANRPAVVVLQKRDWPAEGIDSFTWFMRQPALVAWLEGNYRLEQELPTFSVWRARP